MKVLALSLYLVKVTSSRIVPHIVSCKTINVTPAMKNKSEIAINFSYQSDQLAIILQRYE